MSKPSSPQEKSVKKHERGLLRIIVILKMPGKRSRSAQMTRPFKQAHFVEKTSKERRSNIMTLLTVISTSQLCTNVITTLFRRCIHTGLKERNDDRCAMSDHFMHAFFTGELCSGRVGMKLFPYNTSLENILVEGMARNKHHPVNERKSSYIIVLLFCIFSPISGNESRLFYLT